MNHRRKGWFRMEQAKRACVGEIRIPSPQHGNRAISLCSFSEIDRRGARRIYLGGITRVSPESNPPLAAGRSHRLTSGGIAVALDEHGNVQPHIIETGSISTLIDRRLTPLVATAFKAASITSRNCWRLRPLIRSCMRNSFF